MEILKHPKKTPLYREGRSHEEFICKLKEHLASKDELFKTLITTISDQFDITSNHGLICEFEASRSSTELLSFANKSYC